MKKYSTHNNPNKSPFPVKEILSIDAYRNMLQDNQTTLVDVRTEYEWESIGYPDLSAANKEVKKISWRLLPDMEINPNFIEEFKSMISDKDMTIYFLCRGGSRSFEAASVMSREGYTNCVNIIGGFEGHGEFDGWKYSNLPWRK